MHMETTEAPGPEHWFEEGAATNNPPQGDTNQAVDVPLPPGVHPMDPSQVWLGGNMPDALAAPHDYAGAPHPTGRAPFHNDNTEALAVYQRGDKEWSANRIVVDTNNSGTVQLIGRQKGRVGVTLSVPSSAATGIVFAPTEGEVLNSQSCPALLPGDSITIPTEASVWAGVIGANTTGTVDVIATYNPAGGGLGSM